MHEDDALDRSPLRDMIEKRRRAYSYVRMSTDAQLKGDSLRRQVEKTEKYAAENGLDLDRSYDLHDIGRSAYDGSNVDRGQLGKFLRAVEEGKIERGSFLVVESIDRLSRQKVRASLRMFLDLLEQGISIVTLIDRRVYTPDSDHMDLMMSLGHMARAHDESLHKSARLAEAWEHKRRNMGTKNLTAVRPGWLDLPKGGKGFVVNPERAALLRRIFEDATQGMGAGVIARRLNQEKIPAFRSRAGWHKSYVLKILRNAAVIGTFQPHTKRGGGKRRIIGAAVEGYYPEVIERDLFYRTQSELAKRKGGGGGRKGSRVTNLFTKIVCCGNCGMKMHLKDRGTRGARVLICDGVTRGLGCAAQAWRYDDLERSVLTFVREADLLGVVNGLDRERKRHGLEDVIRSTQAQLDEAKRRRDRAYGVIIGDEPTDFAQRNFRTLDVSVAELEGKLAERKKSACSFAFGDEAFTRQTHELSLLVERLREEQSDDVYRIRSALAAALPDVVKRIDLYPGGRPTSPGALRVVEIDGRKTGCDRSAYSGILTPDQARSSSFFAVRFAHGGVRYVYPRADDPTRFTRIAETGVGIITDEMVAASAVARSEDAGTSFGRIRSEMEVRWARRSEERRRFILERGREIVSNLKTQLGRHFGHSPAEVTLPDDADERRVGRVLHLIDRYDDYLEILIRANELEERTSK